jgi:hypothetical protein
MGSYECDGVVRCPGSSPEDPDEPIWGVYRYMMHAQDDEEPFLDLISISDGLTVTEAVDLAAKLGYGWPVGV